MAKPTWLSLNPTTGSGNGTIVNTGTEHTGRVAREGNVTVTAVGVATPKTYKVTQKPKSEFVEFTNGPEMAFNKEAGTLSITGKSNSSKLTFAFVGEAYEVELPTTFTAAGKTATNGEAIADDPGATAEYEFALELTIPANDTVDEIERTIKVTANGAQAAQIVVKQAAGDARIELEGLTDGGIVLEADGSAVSVDVVSNTTWTVS